MRWHDADDVAEHLHAVEHGDERYLPSPSEIESESAAIRDAWSRADRAKRAGAYRVERVEGMELDRHAITEHVRSQGGWGEE